MAAENHRGYFDNSMAVTSTAIALEIPQGTRPCRVTLQPVAGAIHYRYTGNLPDTETGSGHYLSTYEEAVLEGVDNITQLRVIRAGSTDATLFYTLERE